MAKSIASAFDGDSPSDLGSLGSSANDRMRSTRRAIPTGPRRHRTGPDPNTTLPSTSFAVGSENRSTRTGLGRLKAKLPRKVITTAPSITQIRLGSKVPASKSASRVRVYAPSLSSSHSMICSSEGIANDAVGSQFTPMIAAQRRIRAPESKSCRLPGCYDLSWAPSEVRAEDLKHMGPILPLSAGSIPALTEGPCPALTEGPTPTP